MAEPRPNSEPSSAPLHVRVRRTARLRPWALILLLLNLASLVVSGVLSNVATSVNWIWWLWLLGLAASGAFLAWRMVRLPRFYIGPEGIKYGHGRLQVAYNWSEIASVTIATRARFFGQRTTICLRPFDGLGPEVLFAQRLSRFSITPPFLDGATGWIVVCEIDQFSLPATHVREALATFAGQRMRPGA
ncbi:hypothetical protein [Actinomadura rubrisoli]|uniref:PH domain-containing protein n=1 Tax=Actinomadura rubrisoli TaxID=2530368 RepID=A0A4R5C630_9ACTN|nr:hypothetical protein [Actinomadura rubrisoli]TDD94139.1 hypothetical protein E1298_07450 [Actinomadura rubrisoli]